jgi:two-component system, NtrC family, sensor kinase
MSELSNRRILLIDDTPSIHVDFRKILTPKPEQTVELDEMEAALFGSEVKSTSALFELDSAYGGQEGLGKLKWALQESRPYALAFVDMRMPEGWDGAQTIEHLWQADPRLQVVVCTAYSDYSWEELLDRLQAHDRLLILKKPFDNIEVQQMANTLLTKWDMTERASVQMDHLGQMVEHRTRQFKEASVELQREIDERKQLETQLVQSEKLASLGQLAAGVAHEINNPIGFISSNLGTLDGYFKQLQEMLDAYRDAEEAIGASELVERLNQLRERVELEFLREDIPLLIKEPRRADRQGPEGLLPGGLQSGMAVGQSATGHRIDLEHCRQRTQVQGRCAQGISGPARHRMPAFANQSGDHEPDRQRLSGHRPGARHHHLAHRA